MGNERSIPTSNTGVTPVTTPPLHYDRFMNAREAAQFLRVSPAVVRNMASTGRIPATKIHGRWEFSMRDIMVWFKSNDSWEK